MATPNIGPCFKPWVFIDQIGQLWALGMSAGGQLTLGSTTVEPVYTVVPVLDVATQGATNLFVQWMGTFPQLVTGPTSNAPATVGIPLSRPGVGTYLLQTNNGVLFARLISGPGVPDPVVGQLFNIDLVNPPLNPPNTPNAGIESGAPGGCLPVYTQPGGIGTQSFPAQASGGTSQIPYGIAGTPYEIGMGLNVSPCGHWFNSWEITFTTVQCQQAAIVRCPLCGYIQEIIIPASLLYTDAYAHISS